MRGGDRCPFCGRGPLVPDRGGTTRCSSCGAHVDLDSEMEEDEDMGF